MNLQIYGINYKSADIFIREKYYLNSDKADSVLLKFRELSLSPLVIISTCNRTEFYFTGKESDKLSVLEKNIGYAVDKYFRKTENLSAVRHLFRVAGGLESQMLGESEILSQVKNAYYKSLNIGTTDKFFNVLFNRALKVAKDIRRTTGISAGNISFAGIVFNEIKRQSGDMDGKNFLLIGTGVLAETVLSYFSKNKIKLKIVSGKNYDKAAKLAEMFETEVICFDKLKSAIGSADVIVTATNAPHFLVGKNDFKDIKKNCFIFDLSVPRNVNPDVKSGKIILYNLDDLKKISDRNLELRKKSVIEANNIIKNEMAELAGIWRAESESEQGRRLWH